MVVTIQKEVADRLIAQPGTKDYGPFSLWVQSQCDVELLRIMPPSVFWPRPKVDSAIVRIRLDAARRSAIPDLHYFHSVVRALFLHRRKLLRGVLVSAFKTLDKPDVDAILSELNFSPTARAEELNVEHMLALCEVLQNEFRICTAQPARKPPPKIACRFNQPLLDWNCTQIVRSTSHNFQQGALECRFVLFVSPPVGFLSSPLHSPWSSRPSHSPAQRKRSNLPT